MSKACSTDSSEPFGCATQRKRLRLFAIWLTILLTSVLSFENRNWVFARQAGGSAARTVSPGKKSQQAKLFFFTAPWCEPCQKIKPFLRKLAKENSSALELIEIDWDLYPEAERDFDVQTLPTLILLNAKQEILLRVETANRQAIDALKTAVRNLVSNANESKAASSRNKRERARN